MTHATQRNAADTHDSGALSGARIVLATRLYLPEAAAASLRLGALTRALRDAGAEVDVVTSRPPATSGPAHDESGVRVSRWPVLRDRAGNLRGYVQYASFDGPLALRILGRRADMFISETPPTTGLVVSSVAALRRRPFIYYAADVWTDGVVSMGASRIVVSLMRWMERTVLRRASAVMSVSTEVTERLLALAGPRVRVHTVGNGIDTNLFNESVTPIAEPDPYVVYTGTMSEWQQPEILVEAFARIMDEFPDLRLKFFGQGSQERVIRDLAERVAPGRVDFGGVVPPQDAARWLAGAVCAAVTIVPGTGYDFAKPTKTYAAAAVGTPVLFVGPGVGGGLVTENDLGIAVDWDVAEVADGMRRMIIEHGQGLTVAKRAARARWARENVSLSAAAGRVVTVMTGELTARRNRIRRFD